MSNILDEFLEASEALQEVAKFTCHACQRTFAQTLFAYIDKKLIPITKPHVFTSWDGACHGCGCEYRGENFELHYLYESRFFGRPCHMMLIPVNKRLKCPHCGDTFHNILPMDCTQKFDLPTRKCVILEDEQEE